MLASDGIDPFVMRADARGAALAPSRTQACAQ